MSAQVPNTFVFRWRSLFGVAVALFLLYGAFNVLSAVFVPVSLHLGGAGAAPGGTLVLSETADAELLGRSLADLDKADPALGAFLVSFMDTMCAYMMAFALLQLGVAWVRPASWSQMGAMDFGDRRSLAFPVLRCDHRDLRRLWRSARQLIGGRGFFGRNRRRHGTRLARFASGAEKDGCLGVRRHEGARGSTGGSCAVVAGAGGA
jgi:hypothetical protein